MSTNANCIFVETEPGKWWYKMQKWPYGETPDYHIHGPFESEAAAIDHMSEHYQNPGGWSSFPFKEAHDD